MLEKLSLYFTVKKPGDTHDFKDCVITGVNGKEKLLFNFNFFNFKSKYSYILFYFTIQFLTEE